MKNAFFKVFIPLLLAALCLLTGCKKDAKLWTIASLTELSDSKKVEILTDLDTFRQDSLSYVEWWNDFWCDYDKGIKDGIEYYGTYNGTMVFLFPTEIPVSETINIAGLDFRCYENQLLAYKDHTFYYLNHAYYSGLLTQEDIVQIHDNHWFYFKWRAGWLN